MPLLGTKCAIFGPKNDFLGVYGDETLLIAKMGQNLIWWTLFGIQCNKDLLSKTVIPLVQGPPPGHGRAPMGKASTPRHGKETLSLTWDTLVTVGTPGF